MKICVICGSFISCKQRNNRACRQDSFGPKIGPDTTLTQSWSPYLALVSFSVSKIFMKRLHISENWPDSWKYSYPYDLMEIWGETTHRGYAYAYASRQERTLQLISEALPPGSKILDVAAAQGNFSLTMAEQGYRVTWNDLREDLEEYVRQKHETGEIEFAPGNVFELGFKEDFDCVLITEIIEHVAHPNEFLKKIASMVKPGGYIVMSTPNGAYFRNRLPRFSDCPDSSIFEDVQFKPNSDGHIFLLWPDEIVSLGNKAGLKLEKHSIFTNSLTAGHIKLETVLKILPRSIVNMIENLSEKAPFSLRSKFMTNSASRFRKPVEQKAAGNDIQPRA